jgi:hypothetical protein
MVRRLVDSKEDGLVFSGGPLFYSATGPLLFDHLVMLNRARRGTAGEHGTNRCQTQ